jgi:hypothetical protein
MHKYPHIKIVLSIVIFIVAFTTISQAADSNGLLLYAPFQNSSAPEIANGNSKMLYDENVEIGSGKSGGAAKVVGRQSQLVYDGPGNAYCQAGTASLYWRLDADPEGKSVTILNLTPLQHSDKDRYIQLSYVAGKFRLYLSAGNLGGQTLTSKPIMVLPGEWHQLTLCWDQTYGAALLVDGEVAFQFDKSWFSDGAIGSIGLGVSNSPGRPPVTSFSQSFDEFRIYDRWLTDANLQKLIHGSAAGDSALDVTVLSNQRLALYQWNKDNAAKLPQLKLAIGGGLALRQVSVDSSQTSGRELFDGDRSSYWPADKSTFNQTLPITISENEPFDILQMLAMGHLVLTSDEDKKQLADSKTDDLAFQSFMLQSPVSARQLSLQTLGPVGQDTFKSSAAYDIQLFKQIRYPYEFDNSWQKFSLRPATSADQSLDALLHIRQAFYSSDQRTFIAQEGSASGQITIPAMQTVHIVGPSQSQDDELDAVAIELNLLGHVPEFARVQLTDPQNPLQMLASVDVHLNNGPGLMRLLIDNRDVQLPQGARPVISITFSDDAIIDPAGSCIRYQWKK